ncbi:MAG: GPR endopeptidase [Clostridia bacterium]|nr:GPR endopeptidase [Clostridia bacterium]
MNEYIRSDLALENRLNKNSGEEVKLHREEILDFATVNEIVFERSENNEGGRYVCVSKERLWQADGKEYQLICDLIGRKIVDMAAETTGKKIDKKFCVLVAGLGNSDITADAIGPLTIKNLTVTRHLREMEPKIYSSLGFCEIAALSPGVLGQTGIETVELIRGAVQNCTPDIVIVIDALAARSCERLAATVQISDAGIRPGSGIGNMRMAINTETLGVPVISVGIPTVVNSSTLLYEALNRAGIKEYSQELQEVLENGRSFFVTPKESDIITKQLSLLLSDALSMAFTVKS